MAKGTLSADDVARLMADPSGEARAETAEKLAGTFGEGALSESERAMAEDIFRLMAKDAEERVRRALAQNLKDSTDLSAEIAGTLARDRADSVALPILQFSDALDDADLIDIVRAAAPSRQVAVAGRAHVSDSVADAIVDSGNEDAVVTLVGNEGAELSEDTLGKVVRDYGEVERVQAPLVHRDRLPVTIAEKLVAKVSEALQEHLVTHHALSEGTASDLILQSRERATVQLAAEGGSQDVEALVDQLAGNGRLTPSLVLRGVCLGDLSFFEAAMARLAGVPLNNARVLIHDEGSLGLRSLYDKAGLPPGLFPAFETAARMARTGEDERTDEDPEARMRRLLEHVLTEHEEIVDEFGIENVDYLLTKFNALAAETRAA